MLEETVSGFLLFLATGLGAALTALWAGLSIWTWRDIRARSRDGFAHLTATALVALLNVFGLLVYLMLRPRETLAEAYERSLEEEALLQGIEEKPVCPACGRPTQAAWQVCPYCHTRLRKPCVECGQLLELAWTLCPYCTAVQAADAARRSRRRAPQPAPLEYMEGDSEIE